MKKEFYFISRLALCIAMLNKPAQATGPGAPAIPAHVTHVDQIIHRFDAATNKLDLSETNIEQIDDHVFTQIAQHDVLQNLQELDLNNTQIQRLPPEIGNLINLRRLWLFSTRLRSLPAEIGWLQRLEILDLNNTQLQNLPIEIGNLNNLQTLWLSNTQLQQIPDEIINNLRNLQELYLTDTPLVNRQNWPAIRAHLHAQLPNARIYPE